MVSCLGIALESFVPQAVAHGMTWSQGHQWYMNQISAPPILLPVLIKSLLRDSPGLSSRPALPRTQTTLVRRP